MELLSHAIVLKNFIPLSNKVILLHKQFGKITCIYSSRDQAAKLCTGTLIKCSVEKYKNSYKFYFIEIRYAIVDISIQQLSFIHDVTRLCLHMLPSKVPAHELFDFVWYVYQNITMLSTIGQNIVYLRLFLLFDLLVHQETRIYQFAAQDPYGVFEGSEEELRGYVRSCWNRFYQEINNTK